MRSGEAVNRLDKCTLWEATRIYISQALACEYYLYAVKFTPTSLFCEASACNVEQVLELVVTIVTE